MSELYQHIRDGPKLSEHTVKMFLITQFRDFIYLLEGKDDPGLDQTISIQSSC